MLAVFEVPLGRKVASAGSGEGIRTSGKGEVGLACY